MTRLVLIVIAVAVGGMLLYWLERVALLLVLATFFAYLIAPLVAALSVAWRHGLVWLDEGQRSMQP